MEPIAYDIGPANGLMDAAIFAYSKGKATFDTDGKLASEGKINATHLKKFLSHPYYTLSAPKSTGKEIFHLPYVIEIIGPIEDWVIEDVLAAGIRSLISRGFTSMSLWVFKENIAACSLYSDFGFLPTGKKRVTPEWEALEIEMSNKNINE